MVSRFRRTVSFPKPTITTTIVSGRSSSSEKFYHIRSVSLPCRSHPLISQLNDEINDLKTWLSESDDERNSFWLCDGLIRLKNLHDSFNDYLQLSKTQESLCRRSDWIEKLLEDFLRFIDVFGLFRATLVTFKEEQSLAQVALRRRDELKIVSYVKNRKKIDKELKKLVSNVKLIGKCSVISHESLSSYNDDAELVGILQDLNEVTVSFIVSMLNAISASSSMTSCIGSKMLMKKNKQSKSEQRIQEIEEIQMEDLRSLRKEGDKEVRNILKKLEVLENCVVEIESESGKMFGSLMNTRVSLLNIVTQ
ncbi:hypothetical protein AQUCO_01500449v1 [Aquilegia coerulea]|uniref:DUF241 domain-containing protein n=1 Tax=Aquilegia coerulea TaxID=218851 RepID=A0A2G5DU01_AQUCA|nr:hypothetical protein AQUCO_01500449v1 [Aquilegia coerulea]